VSDIEERQRGGKLPSMWRGARLKGLARIFGSYAVVVIMPRDRRSIFQQWDLADQRSPPLQ